MIKIIKPKAAPRKLLIKQRLLAPRLEAALRNNTKFEWHTKHYSRPIKDILNYLYHNKCGFCEQKLGRTVTDNQFTIEHYRPKSADGGYPWLGAEWTNLIPVCRGCNGRKDDDFPIFNEQNKVVAPPLDANGHIIAALCKATAPQLLAEAPVFLHPEIDEPDNYLSFELFSPISKQASGKAIQPPHLSPNDAHRAQTMQATFWNRPQIEEKRKAKLVHFLNKWRQKISISLEVFSSGTIMNKENIKNIFTPFFNELQAAAAPDAEFSRLGWHMLHHFERLFMPYLKTISDNKDVHDFAAYTYALFKPSI